MVTDKGMMDRVFCHFGSFWVIFLPFDPPNNPKNQDFESMKKKKKRKSTCRYHFTLVYHK